MFRIDIGCIHEIPLLKKVVGADGMVKMQDTEAAQNMEEKIVALPKLASTLHR